MNIENITRAFLVWRSPFTGKEHKVAIISEQDGETTLTYCPTGAAKDEGFTGYLAFNMNKKAHNRNVMESFSTRLPSPSRSDYHKFLKHWGIPEDAGFSSLTLLTITGGRLPRDTFSFCRG